MTVDELKKYYTDLLLIQYKGLTKARATIALLSGEAIADSIIAQVRDCWNLETAKGPQLDILGRIWGLSRYIYTADLSKDYFGMPHYGDTYNNFFGMIPIADIPAGGYPITAWFWETYHDVTVLDDDTFRRLIKYGILLNTLDGTMENIDWLFCPTATRIAHDGTSKTADQWFAPSISLWGVAADPVHATDNGDMTLTYTINATQSGAGFDNRTLLSVLKILLFWPKPAGVETIIVG
jgi:hypothetical protein